MLLSAILLASAVQAGPAPVPAPLHGSPGQTAFHDSVASVVAALDARRACRAAGLEYARQPAGPPTARKLGDLPPADHTLTVLRSVDGCPVSSTVRYNVDLPPQR